MWKNVLKYIFNPAKSCVECISEFTGRKVIEEFIYQSSITNQQVTQVFQYSMKDEYVVVSFVDLQLRESFVSLLYYSQATFHKVGS